MKRDCTQADAGSSCVRDAGREAKCPYVLLLRRHCPLPALLRKPSTPSRASKRADSEHEMLTADEPRLTGASARSMELDLDLDYQFDSPVSSPSRSAGPDAAAAQSACLGGGGRGPGASAMHSGSKTANDPVRRHTPLKPANMMKRETHEQRLAKR